MALDYFQYDDMCHTSKVALKEIKSFFVDGIISKELRQLLSPDMSPPVFFFCRGLPNKPGITDNLKSKITNETAATFVDVECPHDLCRQADRNQFRHLL
jgi:hypothetical protein